MGIGLGNHSYRRSSRELQVNEMKTSGDVIFSQENSALNRSHKRSSVLFWGVPILVHKTWFPG
jgi:hypothetical protein